jgi:hypothetical protein
VVERGKFGVGKGKEKNEKKGVGREVYGYKIDKIGGY